MANKGRAEAGKALEAARVAETEAASHRPTAAQKQKQIAELEDRAQLFGDPVKQSAQAKVLERKWQSWRGWLDTTLAGGGHRVRARLVGWSTCLVASSS